MGTVVWQLNDCWPVTSWAAVDGDGRKKLLWYALRDACAPHLLTIQPRDGALQVFGVNDSVLESWRGDVTVRADAFRRNGSRRAQHPTGGGAAGRRVDLAAGRGRAPPTIPAAELLVARTPSGAVALHFFVPDKDLRLPDPESQVEVLDDSDADDPDVAEILVTATALARHVALLADRLSPGAVSDDALVTLLPGQSHTFRVCRRHRERLGAPSASAASRSAAPSRPGLRRRRPTETRQPASGGGPPDMLRITDDDHHEDRQQHQQKRPRRAPTGAAHCRHRTAGGGVGAGEPVATR